MALFNRSKNIRYADFGSVGLDMHSHLIPGVDDGAKDTENSIELIKGLKELGFQHLITTPHTLQDIHPNTKETLLQGYALLREKLSLEIKVELSSEYYLDEQFQHQLLNNTLIPLPGNRLLIEFSQIFRPNNLEEVIFNLRIKGYQLILAHPERYHFFHKDFSNFNRLKEMEVEFQVNALSLTKYYGQHVKSIAEKLIDKDMIDFIGTDVHHMQHINALKQVPGTKYFARLIDSKLLKNQTLAKA
jgi:protein-tyrosine phosphatase